MNTDAWCNSLQLPYANEPKFCLKRSPPVSDHLVLTFWVVAYGMLSCHNYDRLKIITSYPGWDLTASTAANEAMCCKYGGR